MTLPQVGRYHAVTPGPDGPEPAYFDPGRPGMEAAMRAAMRVRDGVPRTVTSVSGRVVTELCTITDGAATAWPEGSAVIPARKTPRKGKRS